MRCNEAAEPDLLTQHIKLGGSMNADVHASKPNWNPMQIRTQSRRLIPFAIASVACTLSFILGYIIRGQRTISVNASLPTQHNSTGVPNYEESISLSTNESDFESLLALIEESIDPDDWLESGGASTILEYPSNITACTVEDIFGSREAYLEMFDAPQGEHTAEDEPLRHSADDNPFDFSAEQ